MSLQDLRQNKCDLQIILSHDKPRQGIKRKKGNLISPDQQTPAICPRINTTATPLCNKNWHILPKRRGGRRSHKTPRSTNESPSFHQRGHAVVQPSQRPPLVTTKATPPRAPLEEPPKQLPNPPHQALTDRPALPKPQALSTPNTRFAPNIPPTHNIDPPPTDTIFSPLLLQAYRELSQGRPVKNRGINLPCGADAHMGRMNQGSDFCVCATKQGGCEIMVSCFMEM
ncbi:hypothetical protein BKA63DRAFT_280611 [Paraphoma chrysanthemicola]|nr:hypothetical protein BKA63DRAFT_280611 [Paraphoma chrysanthemicola]